jgi:N-acetylglucosaminyl-diphospho-decaprenol L-rhamnosyltransferase
MCDLSIVVLVWRDAAFLPACLESIAAAQADLDIEIILVENGITVRDQDLASVSSSVADHHVVFGGSPGARQLSSIIHIHNDTNRGVAPARNQGLQVAQGRYLMSLDVDTMVTQGALVQLVRFMDENAEVGLAGPRLQDAQGNLQLTCRRLPTVWSKMMRRIPTRWARAALDEEMLVTYDHRAPRAVDYVIGACQIIRRQAFEQIGLLDEHFFYGPEDVDYCIRMWQNGWRVMYAPGAVVIHVEQRLTKQHTFSKLSLIHAENLARYFFKYRYAFTRPVLTSVQRL